MIQERPSLCISSLTFRPNGKIHVHPLVLYSHCSESIQAQEHEIGFKKLVGKNILSVCFIINSMWKINENQRTNNNKDVWNEVWGMDDGPPGIFTQEQG